MADPEDTYLFGAALEKVTGLNWRQGHLVGLNQCGRKMPADAPDDASLTAATKEVIQLYEKKKARVDELEAAIERHCNDRKMYDPNLYWVLKGEKQKP